MSKTVKRQTLVIRGKASYAKILGEPRPNYNKDGKEWTIDLLLTDAGVKQIEDLGIKDRIKSKPEYNDGNPYFIFRQKELRADGTPNQIPVVVAADGSPWDQNTLIGNGSTVDVKFQFVDYGTGKFPGVYLQAVRILDLVEYNPPAFGEMDKDDEFYVEPVDEVDTGDTDDLDDEITI